MRFISADGYGSFWQIIHNVWQIQSPSKRVDVSHVNIIKLPRSRGHSAKPACPLGREMCQYEHNVSSTYASTFARSIPIPLFLCPSEGSSVM